MYFDLGDPIPLGIDTVDTDQHPADAGTVTLTVDFPDDTSLTYTSTSIPPIEHVELGRYELNGLLASQVGRHYYRWVATGANASSYGPDLFDVRSASGRILVSLAAARKALNKTTADEDELRETIDAATAPIEDIIGPVALRSVEEVYSQPTYRALVLRTWPALSLTALQPVRTGGQSYNPIDLDLDTELAVAVCKDQGSLLGPLRVTYCVGRRIVDPAITEAAKIMVRHMWELQRAGRGSRSGIGEDADDVVPTPSGFLVPRRVSEMLYPFRRPPNPA